MNFFSLVSTLVALAAASIYINYRYIRLPTMIGVMLVAWVGSLALIRAADRTWLAGGRTPRDTDRAGGALAERRGNHRAPQSGDGAIARTHRTCGIAKTGE
ncbi:MAG: hypothetical protein WBP86_07870 [Thiobacillaceae bacterium]